MKKEFEVKCKNCGKLFTVIEEETKFPIKGDKYFCCRSCANTRHHSKETKQKISNTINKGINEHKYLLKNQYGEYIYGLRKCICEYCGKEFESNKQKRFCSKECKLKSAGNKISILRQKEIELGIFQGWKSRNIISYAENFWQSVLENNNISYIKEYHFNNKYFLDFYIEINNRKIDLEIDGKQHQYEDRKLHDIERDNYLSKYGLEIYRISWNEINSDKGKKQIEEKINKFLNYIA